MSNVQRTGIVYTEYPRLRAGSPFASLWSYHTEEQAPDRPAVLNTKDGHQEFWLERSDPLLNTMLPGTLISVVVNLGEAWASGHTLFATDIVPSLCVVGPITRPRLLRVGPCVQAVGAVFPAALAFPILGCTAGELVDAIVRLDDFWSAERVAGFVDRISPLDKTTRVAALRDALLPAVNPVAHPGGAAFAAHVITRRGGQASIASLATASGLSRQQFTLRFRAATGLAPKQFARISRFQRLLHTLLSTDVDRWAME